MVNIETKKVDQFDLGHGLVEKVIGIIVKRVFERKGLKGPENGNKIGQTRLTNIEEKLKEIHSMIEEIKKAVV